MYLFLDIDGVLNTYESHIRFQQTKSRHKTDFIFDPVAVANLNILLKRYNPVIVISSSWRQSLMMSTLRFIFEQNGVWKAPNFATPEGSNEERGLEILAFLISRGEMNQSPYLVLDDNEFSITPHIEDKHFVHIYNGWETGFTKEHLNHAMDKIEVQKNSELPRLPSPGNSVYPVHSVPAGYL